MATFDRYDFESNFSDRDQRVAMLGVFAGSIAAVKASESSNYAVTYEQNRLRLILGNLRVLTLEPASIFIALDPSIDASNLARLGTHELVLKSHERYAPISSVNRLYTPGVLQAAAWPLALKAHLRFLRQAIEANHALNPQSRANHSAAAEDYVLQTNDARVQEAWQSTAPEVSLPVDVADFAAIEGRPLLVEHMKLERSRRLIDAKRNLVLAETGEMRCEACGFLASDVYSDVRADLCEVHHLRPLGELESEEEVHVSDLAILCPTCHRAIHHTRPMLSVVEFRARYHENS